MVLQRQTIEEELSLAYLHAVCARAGCLVGPPRKDFGVDLTLRYVHLREGRVRDSGVLLDVQAKASTRAHVDAQSIRYELDADYYGDLIQERTTPIILVVLVMPDDRSDATSWFSQTEDQLLLRRCAYWSHLSGRPPTVNTRSITLQIPRSNVFSVAAVTGPLHKIALKGTVT